MNPAQGGAGYWISPSGRYFRVTTHIAAVCSNPVKFGLDEPELRELFAAHGEAYGSEQEAREVVIRHLVMGGWIRARHYGNAGWTVNAKDLENESLARVTAFIRELYPGRIDYTPVRVDSPDSIVESDVARVMRMSLLDQVSLAGVCLPTLVRINAPREIPEGKIVDISITPVFPVVAAPKCIHASKPAPTGSISKRNTRREMVRD